MIGNKATLKTILIIGAFGILSVFIPSFFLRSGVFDISYKYLYIIVLLIYYVMFYIIDKYINIKKFAFVLSLPLLILTIYGLKINFGHLYPVFFPAVNIIFLGSIIPFLFEGKRINTFTPIFIAFSLISIFGFSKFYVNDRLINKVDITLNLDDIDLKDQYHNRFNLDKRGSYIIDCIFTNCRPCIEKMEYLNALAAQNNVVYVLIDGKIDSFQNYASFQKEYQHKFKNLVFIYDAGGAFMKSHKVKIYPSEFVIKEGVMVGQEIGFSNYDIEDYVESRIELLN